MYENLNSFKKDKALGLLLAERIRQDKLWGEQNHHPLVWLGIIMEEIGELSQEILEVKTFDNKNPDRFTKETMLEEAVQVAAVALAIVQSLLREEERDDK